MATSERDSQSIEMGSEDLYAGINNAELEPIYVDFNTIHNDFEASEILRDVVPDRRYLSRSILQGSDTSDFVCSPCASDEKHKEATIWCRDCNQNFCDTCLKYHDKFEGLKGHSLLKIAELMGQFGKCNPASLSNEKCTLHPWKVLEMFCGSHDVVCCVVCIAIDHRICLGVDYLQNVAKGFKSSKEVTNVKDTMEAVKQELIQVNESKEKQLGTLRKETKMHLNVVDNFQEKLLEHLDNLVASAKGEIQQKNKEVENTLNSDIDMLQATIAALNTNIRRIDSFNGEYESNLFLFVKQGKSTEKAGCKILQQMNKSIERSTESLDFVFNQRVIDLFQSVGDTSNAIMKDCLSSFETISDEHKSKVKVVDTRRLSSATFQGEYSVMASGDKKKSEIMGSCLLEKGFLMITDSTNCKLKKLDSTYKIVDSCTFSRAPWGICKSGLAEVAFPLGKTIKFLSTNRKLSLKLSQHKAFKVPVQYDNIASSQGQLIVSSSQQAEIHMYSLTGQCLRQIPSTLGGKQEISEPRQLALNTSGTHIYVADGVNGIKYLERLGHLKSFFINPNLKHVWGMCVLGTGNLLVACTESHTITQIDSQGQKTQVLLSQADGLYRPCVLCHDSEKDRLVVTMKDSNYIKVFDLIWK